MGEGLQRAKDAARATRGLPPKRERPVHLRSCHGGSNTKCGHGGVTFSAPITDEAHQATCKSCLRIHRAAQNVNRYKPEED